MPGLEVQYFQEFTLAGDFRVPLTLTYTWMNAEFESDIADSEYFGDVSRGDSVPYVPDHQAFLSVGLEKGEWSAYVSANYTDNVCTQASCQRFEQTDASTVFDLGVHYRVNAGLELYAAVENLTRQLDIVARQPYGARPGKDRSWILGARYDF